MLHITNGQSAAAVLRAAGFGGDILCWNDVLHEGPVPQLSDDGLRSVRAGFLSGEGRTYEDVLRELTDRDAKLARGAAHEEIVLWFEHDLYDQLQLIQVLEQLGDANVDWARVSLICDAEYLGLSTPERLRERFPVRAAITDRMRDLAHRAWAAFRAPNPLDLVAILEGDLTPLPFLGPALRRHLQQFPSTFNGLSRSEHQALEALAAGAARMRDAYVRSHHEREDPVFLGDRVFADYMRALSVGVAPLVTIGDSSDSLDALVALTPAGTAVLHGEVDRVQLNGIDRWLGGVHLDEGGVWRWNGTTVIPPRHAA